MVIYNETSSFITTGYSIFLPVANLAISSTPVGRQLTIIRLAGDPTRLALDSTKGWLTLIPFD